MRIPNRREGLRITGSLSIPRHEIRFEFTRSGGPGGQHVNKVSTRVDCLFDVAGSPSLSADQRQKISTACAGRIGKDGMLRVSASGSRSQWKNREDALERLTALIRAALRPRATRVPSRPTAGSRERRRAAKKIQAEKKRNRAHRGANEE